MKKFLIVLSVLALCSITFAEEQKKEEPDYRSVIVDAWLVQVSADALYESGVKPLSEKNEDNVSIMNLLWCLSDPNNGEVIVSARTRTSLNERGKTSLRKKDYVKRASGDSFQFTPYEKNVKFENYCRISQPERITIEYDFKSVTFEEAETVNAPPDITEVHFNNITTVAADKPVIIAQTQTGDAMLFLVLRAEIVE